MKNFFKRLHSSESGQTMTEYALILAVIAVVVIGAVTLLGEEIKATFESITASF
ncbi:MAG: Flp family type IVb pilin [Candidatus Peregrinibacteria bacterium]|nr:Flp family type IVb pilin [Candidatus Peregrinibacteria bacterium]